MKAMHRKRAWRAAAAGLATGLVMLLVGDRGAYTLAPSGLGIDPFEVLDLQVKNNVLIVLDTSGSMKFPTDEDDFPMGGDDPASRFYQLKQAVKDVVNANQFKVNLGLATYNITADQKTLLRTADDDNDGNRPDGPFIYVSADAAARNFYTTHSNGDDPTTTNPPFDEACSSVDGFFCQISWVDTDGDGTRDSGYFPYYDSEATGSADLWRSFGNRQGGTGSAFDDPYPSGCTVGSGQLSPVLPSLGAGMRCRYYLQSRLLRNGMRYTWNRSQADPRLRLTDSRLIPGGCPAPPSGLLGYTSATPICFQFVDPSLGGSAANQTSTFYYTSAAFQGPPNPTRPPGVVSPEPSCGGGAVLNQVAPCALNNAGPILTAVRPELPVCGDPAANPPGAACTPQGSFQGVSWPPDYVTAGVPFWGGGHLGSLGPPDTSDNILPPAGLRAGQSTPLQGSLYFIRTGDNPLMGTTGAAPAFPTQAVANQKNFVILLTDGDDTCARRIAGGLPVGTRPPNTTAGDDERAVLAAGQAELLYTNTATFQRNAETMVVAFTRGVATDRADVIAMAGSGLDIDETALTPAAAMSGRTCRAGGACRRAFKANSTQELIDVLNDAIEQAASSLTFSATASVFDGVPEYVNRFNPRRTNSDPMNPDTRYGCPAAPAPCAPGGQDQNPGALIAYRALFQASGFRGLVRAFSSTTRPQVVDAVNGGSRDWEAGQTLLDRIADDLHVRCTAVSGSRPADCSADFAPHTFADIFQPPAADPIPREHMQRRIFTSARNGIAPASVMLWPPDPAVAPTTLVAGTLDEPLFRKFDDTQMTLADLQAAPLKACLGTNLPGACGTSALAQSQKEAREMILAYTAGAEAQRDGAGEPIRNTSGQILYQARTWVLAESTIGQPGLVAPPFETAAENHPAEYALYRDGPRSGGVAVNRIDQGFGLRNPDKDGTTASAADVDLKPVMSVLYVPANDMLHAFRAGQSCGGVPAPATPSCNENGGEELWGYVPYDLLPRLKDRLKPQTRRDHTFMMASSIRFADVFVPGPFSEQGLNYSGKWRRVLMVGRGVGGKYYSALDITAPGPFTRPALSTNLPVILWNRGNPDTDTGRTSGTRNGSNTELTLYANMGQTWSTPIISRVDPARNGNHEYVAYVGSGYGVNYDPVTKTYLPSAGPEGTRFYTLDPVTGAILNSFDVGSASGALPNVPNALLANPVHFAGPLLSSTARPNPANVPIESVFIGDLHGRMWKVDTNSSGTAIAYHNATVAQPIAAAAALLDKNGKPWVFMETGHDQRVTPSPSFKAIAVEDNGTSPGNVTAGFPIDFPGASGPKGPYRGTLQPVTARTTTNEGAAFFPGTRFNPITGGSCESSFDTIVLAARLAVSGPIVTSTEYEDVRAVGTPTAPTSRSRLDEGTPPAGGGEPATPLPPDRTPAPPGAGGVNSVLSLLLRPSTPVCRGQD